jgi:hypothetical protein
MISAEWVNPWSPVHRSTWNRLELEHRAIWLVVWLAGINSSVPWTYIMTGVIMHCELTLYLKYARRHYSFWIGTLWTTWMFCLVISHYNSECRHCSVWNPAWNRRRVKCSLTIILPASCLFLTPASEMDRHLLPQETSKAKLILGCNFQRFRVTRYVLFAHIHSVQWRCNQNPVMTSAIAPSVQAK